MSEPLFFAPYEVPFVDAQTGIISREWYRFLLALWNRVGGSLGPPSVSSQNSVGFLSESGSGSDALETDVALPLRQAAPVFGVFPYSDTVLTWLAT